MPEPTADQVRERWQRLGAVPIIGRLDVIRLREQAFNDVATLLKLLEQMQTPPDAYVALVSYRDEHGSRYSATRLARSEEEATHIAATMRAEMGLTPSAWSGRWRCSIGEIREMQWPADAKKPNPT